MPFESESYQVVVLKIHAAYQLAARGTKERARLGWPFFVWKKYLEKYDVS